jgi:TetR/AcrR family transcriptional regulator, transcriptional repressor of bet genes
MPKVVDAERQRARVIAATWRVVAHEGIEAATIRRIAEAADCTTGLVTHYFQSKEDILVEALRHVFATGALRVEADLDRPPLEALQAVLLDALPLDEQRLLEWRVWLIFWGQALTSRSLASEQQQNYSKWSTTVRNLLVKARQAGAVDELTDVELATIRTLAMVDGLGIRGVFDPSPGTRDVIRSAVAEYISMLRSK